METKYSLPLTHDAFQDLTLFELSIWFWEDYYQKNPIEAKKSHDGHVQFHSDDPLIDKWEREIAQGLTPDLTEGLSPEQKAKERQAVVELRKEAKSKKQQELFAETLGDGFADDYSLDSLESDLPTIGTGSHGKR